MTVMVTHRKLSGQCQRIARYMQENGSITPREAMLLHPPVYRLAARIMELRKAYSNGTIETVSEGHDGGYHARYIWHGPGERQEELPL